MPRSFKKFLKYMQLTGVVSARHSQTGIVHIIGLLVALAAVGLVVFLLVASSAPLKNKLFSNLFPKSTSQAAGATEVKIGNLTLTATFSSIGVELLYPGNNNPTATLQFKKSSDSSWRNALPMWYTKDGSVSPGSAFYGSALLLDPGISYDIKVIVTDPSNPNPPTVTGSISTRAENIVAASSITPTYYIRADGNDGNSGTANTSGGAWRTFCQAFLHAPDGAIVQVGPGYYPSPATSINSLPANWTCSKDIVRSQNITFKAQNPAVDDARNIINSGNHSVVEYGIYTSPTGVVDQNPGVWQQVNLVGPATGQTFSVWKWTSAFDPNYFAINMGYATTRAAIPSRVGYWDRKSGTVTDGSGKVYTLLTPAGWAEVMYTNQQYRYGFTSFGSDIYVRMPGDVNPNNYYNSFTPTAGNGTAGFTFNAPNVRFSGLEVRQIGITMAAGSSFGVIDHNLFEMGGVNNDGSKSTPSVYTSDNVIQNNYFLDSGSWSNDPTQNPGITESWCWIKCSIVLSDGTATNWGRIGAVNETTATGGVGRRIVYRNNTIDGYFNGIGEYAAGFDRYSMQDNDIYGNVMRHFSDDALEPEDQGINIRIWNNQIQQTVTALSTGPLTYGPVYYFRNEIWKLGDGYGKDVNGTSQGGATGFKYSGSAGTKARIFVVNNTFDSDIADGGSQYAGGGNNQERFYLRNNIFRQGRYAFAAPTNTAGLVDKWDEDYNYFSTIDQTRGINYGSNLLSLATYKTNSGQGAHTNLADVSGAFHTLPDNWFTNLAAGDVTLKVGSPLLNAGVSVPNIADISSSTKCNSCYLGSAPDLGAGNGLNGEIDFTVSPNGGSSASTYYIDCVNGNDANNGSVSSPWKTVAKAAGSISSGNTVIIQAGICRINTSATPLVFGPAGTGYAGLTTYQAAPGARVIFSQPSDDPPTVSFNDYVKVDGLWFGGKRSSSPPFNAGIRPGGSPIGRGVQIVNSTIFGYTDSAIAQGSSEYYMYQNNRLVLDGSGSQYHAIYLSGADGSGSGQSNHSIVDNNIIIGGEGYGIQGWHIFNSGIITRNFIADQSWGIVMDGSDHLVANNVLWKMKGFAPQGGFGTWLHGDRIKFYNNILGPGAQLLSSDGQNNELKNNASDGVAIVGSGAITITPGQEQTQIGASSAVVDGAISALKNSFSQSVATIFADQTIDTQFSLLRPVVPGGSALFQSGTGWMSSQPVNIGTNTSAPADQNAFWTAFRNLGLRDFDQNGNPSGSPLPTPSPSPTPIATPTAILKLVPSSLTTTVGANTALSVHVRTDTDAVNLISTKIKFDPNQFNVATDGSAVNQAASTLCSVGVVGCSLNWVDASVDNTVGIISIVVGIINGAPNVGIKTTGADLVIATIHITPKISGASPFNVLIDSSSSVFRNSDNQNILVVPTGVAPSVSAVTVNPSASPTPSATPTPGPTSSPAPTSSPSPTPSPTPIPVVCNLSSAVWVLPNGVTSPVANGQQVTLQVNASGDCTGKTVAFDIKQDNGLLPDDTPSNIPASITFSAPTVAATSWAAQYIQDGPFGVFDPPEYYFKATANGQTVTSASPEIQVNKTGFVTRIKGDATGDGIVNLQDLSVMLSNWNKNKSTQPTDFPDELDINSDNVINTFDFSGLRNLLISGGIITGP